MGAADFRSVLPAASLAAGKGSLLLGEFYAAVPNTRSTGANAGVGNLGQTADTIRISADNTNRGTRFEVIRTGTGDIDVHAGRDVQLRNTFASIYTAGVALPVATKVFAAGDFVVPKIPTSETRHPGQGNLGAVQQLTQAQWSLAGGDVSISAQETIGRYTMFGGAMVVDTSRQLPNQWLYRRGYVDASTGLFASDGGVAGESPPKTVTDTAPSTAWWIDFSNFFQGVGALGGGNVGLEAGEDIVNIDAVVPTNARMAGVDPLTGANLAPDAGALLEFGGGDLSVRAGNNIDGGVYYVEKGRGDLYAGGEITTNAARSPSLGILTRAVPTTDSNSWMPTTLFVGKSSFQVRALKNVLLGPVSNPFLLPQGINNRFWYKTAFNTYSEDAGVNVASYGGGVTHRFAATLSGFGAPVSMLDAWISRQNLFSGGSTSAAYYQPWLRLSELDTAAFGKVYSLGAPNLSSAAFSGDINLVGNLTLFPSANGNVELLSSGSIVGLQPTGEGVVNGKALSIWTAGTINLSDADPSAFPSVTEPLAYQSFVGRKLSASRESKSKFYQAVDLMVKETGSISGLASSIDGKKARHTSALHKEDTTPLRLYAAGGSITGFTLYSPKISKIVAEKDITDISFYLQNLTASDVSLVSAGRDLIPYNKNAPVRTLASNLDKKNTIADAKKRTANGTLSNVLAGDIQINGPGFLEVLAGRTIDLGVGANYEDGTGVGITSIGNYRNPFLPFQGASLVVMAGVKGKVTKPALGLSESNLDFSSLTKSGAVASSSLQGMSQEAGAVVSDATKKELGAIDALQSFFAALRQAATEYEEGGSYATGYAAIESIFGKTTGNGEIFTRSRDIRTATGGAITIAAPTGGLTMASDIFGNPNTPPGIVTEYGGEVSIFTNGDVEIGRTRIFTLRGGDMTIWSSTGDIAAGSSPKTVVTAPPTRVVIDTTSGDVSTDLGGLATGGGIGVLASVKGVPAANVYLIAPEGTVDAGDAGIQATGNIKITAAAVLNADNIAAGGTSTGVPSAPTVAAPNVAGLSAGAGSGAAANAAASSVAGQSSQKSAETEQAPSLITVTVLGYGGGESEEE